MGLEVERWEGVVREAGSEPVGLRDMSDSEKKVRPGGQGDRQSAIFVRHSRFAF